MHESHIVKGRLIGPRTVELDKEVSDVRADVEVHVHPAARAPGVETTPPSTLSQYVRRLPPGRRSKADIDRQVRDEREAWGAR